MKKGFIVLLLALVIVVLASPRVIGSLAEQGVNEHLEWAANEQGDVIVIPTEFDRGWFASTGQHRIELIQGEMYDSIVANFGYAELSALPVLLIDTHLDHGLIPVSSMTRENGSLLPGLGSAVSTLSVEIHDGTVKPLPGKLFSNIGLNGAVTSRFLLEPEGADTEHARIDWGAADFVIEANPNSGSIAVAGVLGSLAVEADDETLIVGKVELDIDLTDSGFGFMVGPATFKLESFAVIGIENTMTAGPFLIDSDSWIDSGRMNADITFRIADTPFPSAGSVGMDIVARFENVDAAAFGQATRSFDAVRHSGFSPAAEEAFEEDLKRMFASGMKVHFDQLDFASPFGQITSKLDASISETDSDNFTWGAAAMALDVSADVSLPVSLVNLATQAYPDMHAAIGMGFLRKKGEFYTMEAAYKQGLLTVNGAPMPIPLSGLQ
ncbi:MAG: DUF945 family protein [Woeseiaceae bacterium]